MTHIYRFPFRITRQKALKSRSFHLIISLEECPLNILLVFYLKYPTNDSKNFSHREH